ncbi:MAG: hypothetical protein GC180_09165 [Bacteroidetes bacterium]|nr:hypothetical protein [Bacteroidota bacterium]
MKAKGFFILLLVFTCACFSWWIIQLERLNRQKLEAQERLIYHQVEMAQNQLFWMSQHDSGANSFGPVRVGEHDLFITNALWERLQNSFPNLNFHLENRFLQIEPKAQALSALKQENQDFGVQLLVESGIFFLLLSVGFVWIYRGLVLVINMSQSQNSFLVSITHELKTPIATNRLLFETLLRYQVKGKELESLAQSGIKGCEHELELVESLLMAAHLEDKNYHFPKEVINLSAWLQNEMNKLEKLYHHKIQLNCQIEPDLFLEAEQNSLSLSLRNLVSNAWKYSDEKGTVEVILKETEEGILLQVGDEGQGVDDQDKKKIFTKFYRSAKAKSQAKQGTGLGLFIVAETIRRLNGKIWVEDRIPMGSMFNLLLKPL